MARNATATGEEVRERESLVVPDRRWPDGWLPALAVGALVAAVLAALLVAIDAAGGGGGTALEDPPSGALEGSLLWQRSFALGTSPDLLHDGVLHLGSSDVATETGVARVHALDALDGIELWEQELLSDVATPAGVADGTMVVEAGARVVGLDAETGTQRWDREPEQDEPDELAVPRPVAVDEEAVVVGGLDLRRLDAGDGRLRWETAVESRRRPVVAGDTAYTAGIGETAAVSVREADAVVLGGGDDEAEEGEILWSARMETESTLPSPPLVTEERVVAASELGEVRAFDRADGTLHYSVRIDEGDRVAALGTGVASGGDGAGIFAVGGESGTVYGFDLRTGERLWSERTGTDLSARGSMRAVDDRVVVSGPGTGSVAALDAATGEVAWQRPADEAAPPAAVDTDEGLVYAALERGRPGATWELAAIDLGSGDELWRLELGGPELRTPLLGEGVLYVPAEDPEAAEVTIHAVR